MKKIVVELPSSKSISNRVLIIRELCDIPFDIQNLSEAGDTQLLQSLLNEFRSGATIFNVKDAGTTCRFMMAYCAMAGKQHYTLHGSNRMHERPQGDLIQALRSIGIPIHCLEKEGFLPIMIEGGKLLRSKVVINGNISSQFISALCLMAPLFQEELEIEIKGEMVSESYIRMTLKLMESFGVESTFTSTVIRIPSKPYQSKLLAIEPDWSSAAFFYAAMIIRPSMPIVLKGLCCSGLQGDEALVDIASSLGVKTLTNELGCELISNSIFNPPASIDFTDYPDLALPIIVALACVGAKTNITGIRHLQFKESDRIQSLKTELAKLNIELYRQGEILSIQNNYNGRQEVFFSSYGDHRIVMSLSLLRLIGVRVQFDDTHCVQKSFPQFFVEFNKLFHS